MTLQVKIQDAIKSTPDNSKQRRNALGQIEWRLCYGLLYAGLDGLTCVLVAQDDPRCCIFSALDNDQLKAKFFGVLLNCRFEMELCPES